jgi:hypothetical protein
MGKILNNFRDPVYFYLLSLSIKCRNLQISSNLSLLIEKIQVNLQHAMKVWGGQG